MRNNVNDVGRGRRSAVLGGTVPREGTNEIRTRHRANSAFTQRVNRPRDLAANRSVPSDIRSELALDQRTSGLSQPVTRKGRMRRSFATLRNRARAFARARAHTLARLRSRTAAIRIEGRAVERRGRRTGHGGQSGMEHALEAATYVISPSRSRTCARTSVRAQDARTIRRRRRRLLANLLFQRNLTGGEIR
jgi:small-conductance mechanosensitive channel